MLVSFIISVNTQQKEAADFLKLYNRVIGKLQFKSSEAEWNNVVNITDHNSMMIEEANEEFSNQVCVLKKNNIKLEKVDNNTRRQFNLLSMTMASRDQGIVNNISTLGTLMENIFRTGRVPFNRNIVKSINVSYGTTHLSLAKHPTTIMATSTNESELLYAWKGWRDAVGPLLRKPYQEYVRLKNIGAREHKFEDAGEFKRKLYEVDNLQEIAETFWNELKPFYEEVHAYARHRLTYIYPNLVKETEPIPAHLLGNMWAQSWTNIFPLVTPYPGKSKLFFRCIKNNVVPIQCCFNVVVQC